MATVSESQRLVNEAVQNILKIEAGTVIHHLILENMLDVSRKTEKTRYYGLVRRVKNALIADHGIFLAVEPRIGYRIARPGEEIDVADMHCTRAIKAYRRGVVLSGAIRTDNIKDEGKKARTIAIAQARANTLGLLKLGGDDVKKAISA